MSLGLFDETAPQYKHAIGDVVAVRERLAAYASIVSLDDCLLREARELTSAISAVRSVDVAIPQTITDLLQSTHAESAYDALRTVASSIADYRRFEAGLLASAVKPLSATNAINASVSRCTDWLGSVRDVATPSLASLIGDLRMPSVAADIARLAIPASNLLDDLKSFGSRPRGLLDARMPVDPRFDAEAQEHAHLLYLPPPELFTPAIYIPRRKTAESSISRITDGHRLIVVLEQALRDFVDEQLTVHFGAGWHESFGREQPNMIAKWRESATRNAKRRPNARLIDFADFGELQKIITWEKHWKAAFEPRFGSLAVVSESFRRLNILRRDTAHSREISKGDIACIYDNVRTLFVCIDVTLSEEFVPEWLR